MNRNRVDPYLEKDINALMVCAPIQCPRESSCFRVARFARDRVRELHTQHAIELSELEKEFVEQYSSTRLYAKVATWEAAA